MRRFLVSLTALSLLGACATVPPAPATPIAAATVRAGAPGVVSAPSKLAAEAGASMLRQGGSAVDAALATAIALTLLESESTGIGGGGFLVHLDRHGALATIDGREAAPAAATRDWFVKDGVALDFKAAVLGGRSVGVPGFLRLAELAHERYGKLPWKALFQPTIALARGGFPMSKRLADALPIFRDAAIFDGGRAMYFDAAGTPFPAGTVIRNPALADLLEKVANQGADAFYDGQNGQVIVAAVNHASRNPAPMTLADLSAYRARPGAATCGKYRGYTLCAMGAPASGAITLLQILQQLERFDLKALGPSSPTSWHLFAELTRLAFADRARFVGDPAFTTIPGGLLDPAYVASRSRLISADRSMTRVAAGTPPGGTIVPTAAVASVEHGTSHVAATDRWGDVASFTSTIENGFGSGLVVNGYFLNNELTDFDLAPGAAPSANEVAGGKRPRSAMSPTIVFGPDGKVAFAIGAGGGATIVAQVAKAVIGVVDWGLPFDRAIALPLVFAPGDTVQLEQGSGAEALGPALQALGHPTKVQGMRLKANAVYWRDGAWHGAVDSRSEGAAVSE